MSVLRVGLLGLDHIGSAYREALLNDDRLSLVAMADPSPERIRGVVANDEAAVFEDCRSLVVAQTRNPIDALFVALPPSQSLDLLPLAAERGIPVFCHAPLGRTTTEARTAIESFEAANVPLVVSRRWSAGLDADTMDELRQRVGRVFCAHAVVHGTLDGADWRGDASRAGGGALLFDGYEAVDALVNLVDLPEMVSAECSTAVLPSTPKKYDTEDAVAVAIRFGRDQIGSLAVCRGASEAYWSIAVIGASGSLTFDETQITLRPESVSEQDVIARPASGLLPADVASFATALLHGAPRTGPQATARQHLRTLATIEAAYLSDRTGSPEAPKKFLSDFL